MREEMTYQPQRIRTNTVRKNLDNSFMRAFKTQIFICFILLVALSIIKLYPDGKFTKTKNAVSLILTQNIDVKGEIDKIKNIFVADENIGALTPVSEFVNPAAGGAVVAGFGVQDAQDSGFHYGLDIKVAENQNITSAASGEVTEIATNEELGSYIVIKHSDKIYTTYAQLGEILPDVGERVERAQPIARANADNNTFYFEIRQGDTYLDPTEFIDFGEHNG